MIHAGGLFILVMGLGIVLGAILPARRKVLLATGAAVASVALMVFGPALSAPLGSPSKMQLWALVGAIALEMVLISVAVVKYKNAGERSLLLAILFVVGLHFLPMAGAFGPLCAVLGFALSTCAAAGLWINPSLPLNRLWLADGLIKAGFGAFMLVAK